MEIKLHNVTLTITPTIEGAPIKEFYDFLAKRTGTKRHVNALESAEITSMERFIAKLPDIKLLRGLGEKSAGEVIDAYTAFCESKLTPQERKSKEMANWAMTRAAQECPFDVGEEVFFFERERGERAPRLVKGTVRAVKMMWGYGASQRRDHTGKCVHFEVYVWHDAVSNLLQLETDAVYKTKKQALASITVS